MSDIHHLPTSRLTPEVLLHQILARKAPVKAVIIITQNEDNTMDCCWSNIQNSDLCMAAERLDMDVSKWLDQDYE
jgi:hypothetical protein